MRASKSAIPTWSTTLIDELRSVDCAAERVGETAIEVVPAHEESRGIRPTRPSSSPPSWSAPGWARGRTSRSASRRSRGRTDANVPHAAGFAARQGGPEKWQNVREKWRSASRWHDRRTAPPGATTSYAGAVDARAWIATLDVAPQRALLFLLLEAVEADERFRALEVGCSFGRGNADELSDLDVGLWIADPAWDAALGDLEPLLRGLAQPLDAIGLDRPWGRWFFVQYVDGRQLDVAAQRASQAKGRLPESVVLLDRDGILRASYTPEPVDRRDEWAFLAWFALANVAKYLARGSLWEALAALEQARSEFLRLHAASIGAANPQFGVTSIFDTPGADVPPQLADTYPGAESNDVRRAARALAELLSSMQPPPIADWVRSQL